MHKKFKLIAAMLFLSTLSCTKIITAKYKLGREYKFKTKSEYLTTVCSELKIPDSSFLYVDSTRFNEFIHNYTARNNQATIYFGTFLNDSISIKKSSLLKDNESCIGRIEEEIEANLAKADFSVNEIDTSINLRKYNFFTIKDNKKVSIFESKKRLKIILIYGYYLGIYYKNLFTEILEIADKYRAGCDLYIVSSDPVVYLKNSPKY